MSRTHLHIDWIGIQGTWQFISIARLVDPWSRPHEVSDDLESFFWVLLYEVVRYRNTFKEILQAEMQIVFDQHTRPDTAGFVGGGKGKLACLADLELPRILLRNIVKTPCREIIEEMRSLFHGLYLHTRAGLPSQVRSELEASEGHDPRVDPRVESAREKLRTSDALLAIMEKYLKSEWDMDDDGSLDLVESRIDPSASRNRRKRQAEDIDDREQNIHLKRRGLMPPRPKRKPLDEHSSQTSYTSSKHETLFSASSKMFSSSGPLSSSLRSGNDGPPAKQ
jgi:Fungal protein kinase